MTDGVAQDLLQSLVRRIENLDDEIKALNDDKASVYKEAKSDGFDVKVLRKIISDRRKDVSERMEFDEVYDLYAAALGMLPSSERVVVRAHVENIEQFDADGVEIEPRQPCITDVQMRAQPVAPYHRDAGRPSSPDRVEGIEDGHPIHTPIGSVVLPAGLQDALNATPVDPFQPYDAPTALSSDVVQLPGRVDGVLRLRPHCKDPSACKSSGGKQHCWSCVKAMNATQPNGAA